MDLLYIPSGLVILGFAGEAMLRGAFGMAKCPNISTAVIGLTVVGLGTSLPELFATVIATLRRHGDDAVRNVLGNIVFNILGTLGSTSEIAPLDFAEDIRTIGAWGMLGVTAAALQLIIP